MAYQRCQSTLTKGYVLQHRILKQAKSPYHHM
uniref:Uncharacterized protein n=1 Tax=Anguilla anguilla TaxID=7936 RepID=A0A0E9S6G3_ANGAN